MNKARILVVDDDSTMVSLIKYKLTKEGYYVLIATDGQTALDMVLSEKPDIIVSDILMPFVSGLEFVDQLRNKLKINTPIVMVSSAGQEKTILEAFELGVNDFISKPFSPAELIVRLKKLLR